MVHSVNLFKISKSVTEAVKHKAGAPFLRKAEEDVKESR